MASLSAARRRSASGRCRTGRPYPSCRRRRPEHAAACRRRWPARTGNSRARCRRGSSSRSRRPHRSSAGRRPSAARSGSCGSRPSALSTNGQVPGTASRPALIAGTVTPRYGIVSTGKVDDPVPSCWAASVEVEEVVEQLVVAEHAADRHRRVVGVRVLLDRHRRDVTAHRRAGHIDLVGLADEPVEALDQRVGVLHAGRDVVVVAAVARRRPGIAAGRSAARAADGCRRSARGRSPGSHGPTRPGLRSSCPAPRSGSRLRCARPR